MYCTIFFNIQEHVDCPQTDVGDVRNFQNKQRSICWTASTDSSL